MKSTKKILAFISAVLVFVCSLAFKPGLSAAEFQKNLPYFTFDYSGKAPGEEIPQHSIALQKAHGKWYIFLPGNIETKDVRVWFYGIDEISINAKSYKSGDSCSELLIGQKNEISVGKKKYDVTVMQGSKIPSLFITTETGSMKTINKSKKHRETGSLYLLTEAGAPEYDGNLEDIHLRGNTSAKFRKKGYQIKLENKTDLLGMGEAKKWVLTSNYRDSSLLRNQITFEMANYAGLQYTPECRQVDLYLNHEYNGTYLFQEKVEIGKSRIDITDLEKETKEVNEEPLSTYKNLGPQKYKRGRFKYIDIPNNPEDITGGYLIEYENWQVRYAEELCSYTTEKGKVLNIKEPEYASKEQVGYISTFMQGYENAIFAEDGRDPKTGKHFTEFIDLDSLVKKYMIEEISKNIDGNQSSQYYYKPSDSESKVVFAGPVWDYDSSYGDYAKNIAEKRWLNPEGFAHIRQTMSDYWWPEVYKKPEFRSKLTEIWNDKFMSAISILLGEKEPENGLKSIRDYQKDIAESAGMNFIVYPIKRNSSSNIAETGITFDENVDYLINFLTLRRNFLDENWKTYDN